MRFDGKSAIVTGAASGIGRAVATRLAAEGARVVLADWNFAGLRDTAAAIGSAATIISADISDPASCSEIVETALVANDGIDVLCNVAGVLDIAPLGQVTEERWSRVISINLDGVFYLSRAAMPHLIQSRGTIINMASTAGLVGVPFNCAYVASKHGVIGLTKALALEFGAQGVRVNAVCPSATNTPMNPKALPPGVDAKLMTRTFPWLDADQLYEADDIADVVAFLASNDARRITGVAVPVDGGQTAS